MAKRKDLRQAGSRAFAEAKARRVLITNEAALAAHLNSGVPAGPRAAEGFAKAQPGVGGF